MDVQWLEAEVIKGEHFLFFELDHLFDYRAVHFCKFGLGVQLGGLCVKKFFSFAAGLISQGAGKVTFAYTDSVCHQNVFSLCNLTSL